jgi:hypothetical protein
LLIDSITTADCSNTRPLLVQNGALLSLATRALFQTPFRTRLSKESRSALMHNDPLLLAFHVIAHSMRFAQLKARTMFKCYNVTTCPSRQLQSRTCAERSANCSGPVLLRSRDAVLKHPLFPWRCPMSMQCNAMAHRHRHRQYPSLSRASHEERRCIVRETGLIIHCHFVYVRTSIV